MAKFKSTTPTIVAGTIFSRWTVLNKTEMRGNYLHHECRCECGTVKFIRKYDLLNGHNKSCGCLSLELTRKRCLTHGHTIGGVSGRPTKVYSVWISMVARCSNPNLKDYKDYGGRGITVCERWLKFENFLEDMGEPPPGLSIDRLDNDAGYSKGNCAWRTLGQQAKNKRKYKKRQPMDSSPKIDIAC